MLFQRKSVNYDGIDLLKMGIQFKEPTIDFNRNNVEKKKPNDPFKCLVILLVFISKGFKRTLYMCLLIIAVLWLLYFNYVYFKRPRLTEGQLNISANRIENGTGTGTGTELRNEV